MNTVKSQDIKLIHRNPLHSYKLTMKNQKEKLRKQSHSPLQQQQQKYLGINLPKETKKTKTRTKNLYAENYKTLEKEIKDNTNRCRDIHVLGLEESILSKWLSYPKQSTGAMHPYKTTHGIFHRTRRKNFTICMEAQKTLNSQNNLEKGEWSWGNHSAWLYTILQTYIYQAWYGSGTKAEI